MPGPPALVMIAVLLPRRQRRVGEDLGQVEQLRDRLDAKDARLGHQGVVELVGAGQRTGVRCRRRRPFRRAAALDHQDRLGLRAVRDLVSRFQEPRTAAHVLDVHHDRPRLRIRRDRTQQIDFVHVALVAETDELREANAASLGVVQQRGTQRAALRDQAQAAVRRNVATKRGVHRHVGIGVDDPQAVRAQNRHAVFAGDLLEALLTLDAFAADFLETGGNDQDVPRPQFGRLQHHRST